MPIQIQWMHILRKLFHNMHLRLISTVDTRYRFSRMLPQIRAAFPKVEHEETNMPKKWPFVLQI